jgi:hypothetical protein
MAIVLTFLSRCINSDVVVNWPRFLAMILCAFTSGMGKVMTDPVFLQAFETVRRSCSDDVWIMLTPRQITEAIYQEMRRIDASAANADEAPLAGPVSDRS